MVQVKFMVWFGRVGCEIELGKFMVLIFNIEWFESL